MRLLINLNVPPPQKKIYIVSQLVTLKAKWQSHYHRRNKSQNNITDQQLIWVQSVVNNRNNLSGHKPKILNPGSISHHAISTPELRLIGVQARTQRCFETEQKPGSLKAGMKVNSYSQRCRNIWPKDIWPNALKSVRAWLSCRKARWNNLQINGNILKLV